MTESNILWTWWQLYYGVVPDGHSFAILNQKSAWLECANKVKLHYPDDGECIRLYPRFAQTVTQQNIKWYFPPPDRYYIGSFGRHNLLLKPNKRLTSVRVICQLTQHEESDIPDGRRVRTAFASFKILNIRLAVVLTYRKNMTIKQLTVNRTIGIACKKNWKRFIKTEMSKPMLWLIRIYRVY